MQKPIEHRHKYNAYKVALVTNIFIGKVGAF